MKFNLIIFALCIAMFTFFSRSSVAFAQTDQIVGGYGEANVKAKDVVAAAKFAVKKGAAKEKATITLTTIKQARMQVVAGLNYEVCLEVNYKKSDKKAVRRYAKAIVYKNLKNVYSLTSWTISNQPLKCKD